MTDIHPTIVYTQTDEAPALATYSLLPIIQAFTEQANINVVAKDISLAARILSQFPNSLSDDQKVNDTLAEIGQLTLQPEANIIKLPNISASIPQLKNAIKELQSQGYDIPDFPDEPENAEQKNVRLAYTKVLGSAVNPVLREGNSDRRAPASVKNFARKHPHTMGKWSQASQTHAAYMRDGDFYSSEQSTTITDACTVRIEHEDILGKITILKNNISLLPGEIIDAMRMSKKALCAFFEEQIQDAKESDVLFSLHVKATMMKVSHPIVFGHAVRVFYKEIFEKYAETFAELGVNPNNGLGNVYEKIQLLPRSMQEDIERDIRDIYVNRPPLAMVNSDRGISNLHVPSDVIVDASMPAMIRDGGKMWAPDGKQKDTKAIMPESTYATIYQEMINFCKTNGAFNPSTMGTVPNVGLMAQKAEEYGSHDKTFEAESNGTIRVVKQDATVIFKHSVEEGDIWRMCQVKDLPIQDWVKLAVNRARASGMPAIFWLDENRAHDAQIINKVTHYLKDNNTEGLRIQIMSPVMAMRYTLERLIKGKDTISVTGNVLRDYLTDLFPIMELGTSAKMLSIVPLMNGGGMFETGAGGSAPKHVEQFLEEGHLRWDSLGEFLALAVSLEDIAIKHTNARASLLSQCLDQATARFLEDNKSPQRRVGELDNRGSHFYISLYWARALAEQNHDQELQQRFIPLANALAESEAAIIAEINSAQGKAIDIGGYYHPDRDKTAAAMRPSKTFNAVLASFA